MVTLVGLEARLPLNGLLPGVLPLAGSEEATESIERPAKLLRIGSMVKQLREEVRQAPLDEASRARLADIHARSIEELSSGLSPELREELQRLTLPFSAERVPSDAELRIAQAQLCCSRAGASPGV